MFSCCVAKAIVAAVFTDVEIFGKILYAKDAAAIVYGARGDSPLEDAISGDNYSETGFGTLVCPWLNSSVTWRLAASHYGFFAQRMSKKDGRGAFE